MGQIRQIDPQEENEGRLARRDKLNEVIEALNMILAAESDLPIIINKDGRKWKFSLQPME